MSALPLPRRKNTAQRKCSFSQPEKPKLVLVHFEEPPKPKRYVTQNGNVWDLVRNDDGTWEYVAGKP